MSAVATAVVGGSLLSGYMSSQAQQGAAETAAGAQGAASAAGIAEQRRQFDYVQQLLRPYIELGQSALGAQQNLIGLGGQAAQRQAMSELEGSPQCTSLMQQGENAMLQNASATGGLRGGNIQGALAQFRPQLLNQLIDNQFARLGNLTSMGQASATGQAAAAQNQGSNIASLLAAQGQAQAGAALAGGQAQANMWGSIGGGIGSLGMMRSVGMF